MAAVNQSRFFDYGALQVIAGTTGMDTETCEWHT